MPWCIASVSVWVILEEWLRSVSSLNVCVFVEQLKFHKHLYGESVLQPKNSAANCIIESSEVLKLQQQNSQAKQLQREADVTAISKPLQLSLPPAAADSNSAISPVRFVRFHFLKYALSKISAT